MTRFNKYAILLLHFLLSISCFNAFSPTFQSSFISGWTKYKNHVAQRNYKRILKMSTSDIDRVNAAKEMMKNQEEKVYSAGKTITISNRRNDANRPFPMSMIVGNENIKTALLLAAVNPLMGGVVISGRRGTAKSVLARALHQLLPPIERVKGIQYNLDPEKLDEVDTFTANMLESEGKSLPDLEREIIATPFVQVPLNVLEDRLLGSVDVEESIKEGRTIFMPGLLARAHRGVLYIDDINLLDSELANILLGIVSSGWVNVEREGMSVRYPCRPLLIATYNPEDAELRDTLLDRIAVSLSMDAAPLSLDQRLDAVHEVLNWQNISEEQLKEIEEEEDAVRTRIIFARESLKSEVRISNDQMKYLCEEASRAGCEGQRAEIFAVEVAKSNAALEGRAINSNDLKLAVKLAIAPRAKFFMQPEDMMEAPPPPPPPPQPQNNPDNKEPEMEDKSDEDADEEKDEKDEPPESEPDNQPEDDDVPAIPQEFMFAADSTVVDSDLIQFGKRSLAGRSGKKGSMIYNEQRGRYIKPMIPRGKVGKLALDATLRAAAPYQQNRRIRAANSTDPRQQGRTVFVEQSDMRTKKLARKSGSLIIFCVDASGSMALNRMNAAKGAAMSLLGEAYKNRDMVCLIPFQGDRAEVLLPPSSSIAMAKNRLESMPCGGGSPLAHAINVAVRTGLNAIKSKDVGKVVIVMLSDGRANVPLATSNGEIVDKDNKPSREELKEEVLSAARALRELQEFSLVVLDTENKFVSTGMAKELAQAAGGRYHYIPKATDQAIAKVASEAITSMKEL